MVYKYNEIWRYSNSDSVIKNIRKYILKKSSRKNELICPSFFVTLLSLLSSTLYILIVFRELIGIAQVQQKRVLFITKTFSSKVSFLF